MFWHRFNHYLHTFKVTTPFETNISGLVQLCTDLLSIYRAGLRVRGKNATSHVYLSTIFSER